MILKKKHQCFHFKILVFFSKNIPVFGHKHLCFFKRPIGIHVQKSVCFMLYALIPTRVLRQIRIKHQFICWQRTEPPLIIGRPFTTCIVQTLAGVLI